MKTAISVADQLLEEADKAATEIGVSRSKLFSIAMEAYLRQIRHNQITEQLNCVYDNETTSDEKCLLRGMKHKFGKVAKDPW